MSRRTSPLGALVLLGAMGNVAMLDLCYDAPVEQHVLHDLAGAVFLLASDGHRLASFFVLDRHSSSSISELTATAAPDR